MKLHVINSNSKGNAYLLKTKNSALLIECGVPFKEIEKAMNFKIIDIDLCLVTHEHKDHSKAASQILQCGIPVISSRGTLDAIGIPKESRAFEAAHGCAYAHGKWLIQFFSVEHDAKQPMGFIISHEECGKILFITDTYRLKWKLVTEFDHILIESNYCEHRAKEWAESKGNAFVEKRRLKSHMSLQTAHLTLSRLDLSKTKNIVLLHLSDGLTHEKEFKQLTEDRFGINTVVAGPGVELDINAQPF